MKSGTTEKKEGEAVVVFEWSLLLLKVPECSGPKTSKCDV